MANYFITQGADANIADQAGNTPLHKAAYKGNVKIINLLLKSPVINVNILDNRAPLHMAAIQNQVDAVAMLIEQRANPTLSDKYGNTPFHLATYTDAAGVLSLLVGFSYKEGSEAGLMNIINSLKFGG